MSDLQKEDKDHPSQRTVVGGEADDGFLEAISIGTGEFEAEETPLVKDDEDLEDDKEREHHRKMQVYYAKREMSPQQEQWNAITMIPNPFYCWYFIVAGHWFINASSSSIERNSAEDISGLCWTNSTWLPAAMPPLPLIAIALAITIHAPFSMLYHWKYAARLSAKQQLSTGAESWTSASSTSPPLFAVSARAVRGITFWSMSFSTSSVATDSCSPPIDQLAIRFEFLSVLLHTQSRSYDEANMNCLASAGLFLVSAHIFSLPIP
eukprot:CAMPEP_0194032752 /NCGR_PEP_ID=MMETSP0009_2-20130614/5625_1 /TAXON_ID=210454 /ORGANISM="Grammatophora oceanica, Strain CCMP 410" /LENGTH=264 /DNA_ID=CAMNT_0038673283 /DNA_START=161 /DNA_END=956 /DNA_ORIENTATION=+